MNGKYNHEDIDRYERNDMDAESKAAFEKDLQQDEGLRENLKLHEDIASMVKDKALIRNLHTQLTEEGFYEQFSNADTKKVVIKPPFRMRRILAYAASVSVLLVAGAMTWANMNHGNIPLADLNSLDNLFETSARSGAEGSVFDQALLAIEQADYQKSKDLLQTIPTTSENYEAAQRHLAYTDIKAENYEAATQRLETLLKTKSSYDTEWLLVKAQLANGNIDEQLLDKIANDTGSPFQEDAQALQSKLNSVWRKLVW